MKLYFKTGACSLSPRIALEEAGLKYETEAVDLKTKVTASGADFLKINAKGYVPTLVLDSGEVLTEGPAIVQYIADLVPAKKLAPASGSIERYRLQSWLNFVSTEIHKSFSPFFNPTAGDVWKAAARVNLERRLGYVNDQLNGKSWLMGNEFTVADGYLFTCLSWAQFTPVDISALDHVKNYQTRVAARPAVQAAMRGEGILK